MRYQLPRAPLWLAAAIIPVLALAQTNTGPLPPIPAPGTEHMDVATVWKLAIAGITPILVTLFRKVVPTVPSAILPLMTPLVGILLGLGMNWLSKANLSWVDMAQAGALAVFVRESFNQVVTKRMGGGKTSATD